MVWLCEESSILLVESERRKKMGIKQGSKAYYTTHERTHLNSSRRKGPNPPNADLVSKIQKESPSAGSTCADGELRSHAYIHVMFILGGGANFEIVTAEILWALCD